MSVECSAIQSICNVSGLMDDLVQPAPRDRNAPRQIRLTLHARARYWSHRLTLHARARYWSQSDGETVAAIHPADATRARDTGRKNCCWRPDESEFIYL